jgi:putative transposase
MVEPAAKREAAQTIQSKWERISERRAAKLVEIPRSTLRSKGKGKRGKQMMEQVKASALKHPRYGHRRVAHVLGKQLAKPVSRRNVQRIMQKLNLQVRTRRRRKWMAREAVGQQEPQKANECWAMDFVSDWCVGSRRVLRILTMVDCFTRESLALKAGYAMSAERVVEVLEQLRLQGRKPEQIRLDNGPEFVSCKLVRWCQLHEVKLAYIERGKPQQNGHCESFNGRLRDECLNGHYFEDVRDAQVKLDAWRWEYLHERPHSGLGGRTPAEFAKQIGVKTPLASLMVSKAKANRRQGNPLEGSRCSTLTAARLGLGTLGSTPRA